MPDIFVVYFRLFQKLQLQFWHQINVTNIYLVSGAGIWTDNLLNRSLIP